MKTVFFKTEKLTDRTTRITGLAGELMYLIEGDEKAALIDTGVGLGSLKELVETLTKKPIIVLLTHGHVDHALGAGVFDEVYMSVLDNHVYFENSRQQHRKTFYDVAIDNWEEMVKEGGYIDKLVEKFYPLEDKQEFNLGGITIEALLVPGHTPGSMGFLIKEERALLLGDACNPLTYIYDHNSLYISEYREILLRVAKYTDGKYDRVYISHGTGGVARGLLDSAIELTQDIMDGNVDDMPFEFLGVKANIAKNVNERNERLDGGIANMVYSKDKIWKR